MTDYCPGVFSLRMYYLVLFVVKFISILPFSLLYKVSDILFYSLYYQVKYRREVVRKNLISSFPEKSLDEIIRLEKKFYRHFCDLIIEGLKLSSMSGKQIDKRMIFKGYEQVLEHYKEGRCVMLMASHYGNWEWTSSFSRILPPDKPLYQVYKRQKDKISNKIIGEIRQRFGSKNVEMRELIRIITQMRSDQRIGMFGMISDQRPRPESIHYWTTLLNQETAMICGTEQIAKKFNYPVYYSSIKKVKRGYYTCTFIPISTEPQKTGEFEITEKYARMLEADIIKVPEFWLWTHNRWKHKRKN